MSGGGSEAPSNASEPYYAFLADTGEEQWELYKQEFLPLELQNIDLASAQALAQKTLVPTQQRVQQSQLDSYLADQGVYDQYGRAASQSAQQYAGGYYDTARAGLDVTAGENALARQGQQVRGDYIDYQGGVLDSMNRELGIRGQYQDYQQGVLQGQQDRLPAQNQLQATQIANQQGQLGLQGQYQGIQRQALEQEAGLQAGRGELAQRYQDYQGGQLDVAGAQQARALEASALQQDQIAARGQLLDQAGPDYDYVTSRAAADYDQAEDRARAQTQRQLEQRGVDPTSGQWQQTMARSFSGQRAAGINAAREAERNASFNKLDRATGDYRQGMNYNTGQLVTGATAQGGANVAQTNFNTGVAGQSYTLPGVGSGQALPGQSAAAPVSPQSGQAGIAQAPASLPNGTDRVATGAQGLAAQDAVNTQYNQGQAAGRSQTGAALGSGAGYYLGAGAAIGGPAGALIGGALGGLLGGLAEGGTPAAMRQRTGRMVSGPSGYDQVPAEVSNPDGSFDPMQLSNNEFVMDPEMVEGIVRQFLNERVAGLNRRLI